MTVTAIATVILYLGQRMPGPIGRADAVHDSRTMRYCLKTHFLISGSGRPLQICVSHHLLRMDLLNKSRQQPAHSTDHRQIRQGCITDPFPGLNPFSTSVHPPGSRKCRRSQPTTLFIRQCIAAARTGHTIGMVLLQKFPYRKILKAYIISFLQNSLVPVHNTGVTDAERRRRVATATGAKRRF